MAAAAVATKGATRGGSDSRQEEDPAIPDASRLRAVARGESRDRDGAVAQDLQEGLRRRDSDVRTSARRRTVLGLDRRPEKILRRRGIPAALLAAQGQEHLESDQSQARRATDESGAHDGAWSASSRRSESRRPLEGGVRANP